MKELINMHDEYTDSDGDKVKILSINGRSSEYPVLGETLHGRERSYTAEGIFNPFGVSRSADLIKAEKPKEKSNMKYVNVGIKSREELAERIKAGGEKLRTKGGNSLHYDESKIYEGESPYRLEDGFVFVLWGDFASVCKKVTWEDDVMAGKPVLCWVWDSINRPNTPMAGSVFEIDEMDVLKYRVPGEGGYKHAEPVKPEETWGYSDE